MDGAMMHCDSCPVRRDRPCLGAIHPPACDDVHRGLPGRAEQLVALAYSGDREVPPPAPGPDLRLAMLADLCPIGAGPCGCGASPRLCGHPDRPAEVWRVDCLVCVSLADWERSIGVIA